VKSLSIAYNSEIIDVSIKRERKRERGGRGGERDR